MTVTVNGSPPTLAERIEFAQAMGLPVLLQSVTVATAQQDIDFTGLNLDADTQYRIELIAAVNAASDTVVAVYYNSDFTSANYQSQALYGTGTTAGASRSSNANSALGFVPSGTGTTISATLKINKISGKSPMLLSQSALMDGVNVATAMNAVRWTGTANVTSIKLRHISNFGVGTVASLFKEPK